MIKALFLMLIVAAPMQAAMSKDQALAKAQTIWGDRAMVGTQQKVGELAPIDQVGYWEVNTFNVIGQGKSWEAAFASIPANYQPPVQKTLGVTSRWIDGVLAVQFWYEGLAVGPEITKPPYSINLDTALPPILKGVKVWVCNSPCILPTVKRVVAH